MIIRARVKPNAKQFSIRLDGEMLSISVDKPAERGEANRRIIEWFAKHGVEAKIVRGAKKRNKLIQLSISLGELKALLEINQ